MDRDIKEIEKYYKNYAGNYYQEFSIEEIEYYKSLDIKKDTSYLVQCENYEKLKKFVFWYLIQKDYEHITYDVNNFVNCKTDRELALWQYDLLILHYNKHTLEYGDSAKFVQNSIAESITTRNREGNSTLLMAEKIIKHNINNKDIFIKDLLKNEVEFLDLNNNTNNIISNSGNNTCKLKTKENRTC